MKSNSDKLAHPWTGATWGTRAVNGDNGEGIAVEEVVKCTRKTEQETGVDAR